MRATWAHPVLLSLFLLSSVSFSSAAQLLLPNAAQLNGTWQYSGCYTDVRRTINAAFTADKNMTLSKCVQFCGADYAYAGAEYANECWCGNKLASGAVEVNSTQCSMPCAGNKTEACGGPNRLTLFMNPYYKAPQPNIGISNWTHIGCYSEGTYGRRALGTLAPVPAAQMSGANCTAACQTAGYILAGTEYGGECYCGNTTSNGSAPAADGCGMKCRGNSSEVCGGYARLNVYNFNMLYPIDSTNSSLTSSTASSTIATSSSSNPSPSAATTSSAVTNPQIVTSSSAPTDSPIVTSPSTTADTPLTTTSSTTADTPLTTTSSTTADTPLTTTSSDTPLTTTSSDTPLTTTSSTTADTPLTTTSSDTPLTTTSSTTADTPPTTTTSTTADTPLTITSSTTTDTPAVITSSTTTDTPLTITSSTTSATSSSSTADTPAIITPSTSTDTPLATSSSTPADTPTITSSDSSILSIASSSSVVTSSTLSRSVAPPPSTTSTTSSATPTPTAPSQPANVANYIFYGCQTEATNIRALSMATYASNSMTLETCQAFCSNKGTTYFGVEYGRECYCGNKFETGSASAPVSDCSMTCSGNKWQFCGNGNRLSVYAQNGTATPSSSTTTNPGVTTTPTSSAAPVATGFPDGWTNQGCWQDGPKGRIMATFQAPDNAQLTQQSCAQLCAGKGYTVSGTEYSSQCFCSKAIYNGGVASKDTTKCNSPCKGNSQQMCGGPGYLTIYSKGTPQVFQPPTPQKDGLNGTWTYQGCYIDAGNNNRTLPWSLRFPGTNTADLCLGRCGTFGYAAAGMQYGEECYCGDPSTVQGSGATKRPESECTNACPGNASTICGGGSRLSLYYWTGQTPQYIFNYPSGSDAGAYSNLVGGVVTPLMTMESITGKVTFLEKWGTGPANSTGAYELDVSQVGNFTAAWRTMHVETDIFCSAGLILPDKAGRQLTIGGWSFDSTYGVRLYTPDGSAGVKGKNDWQENVQQLKLQKGRWYPSAMLMANGSILVMGGEVGSNDRPEPTLEILPYAGPAIEMDWLRRTDPNNLYPFMAVLPSGGIFVAYWNEARILDEVTFATVKTLPNMPGAVNDPLGGRTYPLEGTAVLLPQIAPYSDPLGVLMCGGSTSSHNALDNCVTTYPDVANPTWTLERMPSRRVMTCMAPLPDGTYLIANGAKQGVAGFGLADDPNLNALLYDPSKPVGSRLSIMANTTVARLYHSEAITLLDGRVLITGSDPQDGKHPEEIRVEVFSPPYLLNNKPRPAFTITNKDWSYGQAVTFTLASESTGNIQVSLLGAVSSTHGNSMGARTLFPAVSCDGTTCTVTAPPAVHICPAGWYQMFVLQDGVPAVGQYVRIGGDPAQLGNWPNVAGITPPGI